MHGENSRYVTPNQSVIGDMHENNYISPVDFLYEEIGFKDSWALVKFALRWLQQNIFAIGQQASAWANVDQDLWHHMESPGHKELNFY